jgi:hypothetical protein
MSSRRRSRRPRLIFGPGLAIAIVLSVFVLVMRRDETDRQRASRPTPPGGRPAAVAPPIVREPPLVLRHADDLKLTAEQRDAINSIAEEYEAQSAPLAETLGQATARFEAYMEAQGQDGPADLAAVQEEAASVRELSGELSALRLRYWEQATDELDREQMAKLESLLTRRDGS